MLPPQLPPPTRTQRMLDVLSSAPNTSDRATFLLFSRDVKWQDALSFLWVRVPLAYLRALVLLASAGSSYSFTAKRTGRNMRRCAYLAQNSSVGGALASVFARRIPRINDWMEKKSPPGMDIASVVSARKCITGRKTAFWARNRLSNFLSRGRIRVLHCCTLSCF